MIFEQILLQIFHNFNQERTISAPFHLLKGKRSGQTIQDVGIYHLHKYFSILPKLSRPHYDEKLNSLIEEHYLIVHDEGSYELTDSAREFVKDGEKYYFNGWYYRGNEHIFFARLSLIVQSLSHHGAGRMSFTPIQKDDHIQHWVRQFLLINQYKEGNLQKTLLDEIVGSLESSKVEERAKSIVINRLAGFQTAGLTWQQISYQENLSEMDVQLIYISTLHSWITQISNHPEQYLLLNQLAKDIRVVIPLSGSAHQTAELFRKGYLIEEISHIRRLKVSTIEDHIVEIAMNDPDFSIEQFISKEDIKKVMTAVDDYNTRKLKILHEVVPHLSYFQIRLVLARGE
ncbi:helix-turn-helix domain-containing protein [Lysinibacillus halotolerans]